MRKRGAYLDVYRKEALFSETLDEFDDAREIVSQLINEYKAAESPDYINYGKEPVK